MTHTLIIWDNYDGEVEFYVVPDNLIDEGMRKVLDLADGHGINTVGDEENERASIKLHDWLCMTPEHCSNPDSLLNGLLGRYKGKPDNVHISVTVVCGQIP